MSLTIDEGAFSGAAPGDQIAALQKALTSGYGTDVAELAGGGALRIQSLDRTMQATIQETRHFTLFNDLDKPRIGATVDEWTEQSSVGGFLGGSTNTETGIIPEAVGQYDRNVGLVKYLTTRRQVSVVIGVTNNIVDAEAIEQKNGALQLMSDANFLCYEGDAAVVPTEFDGIRAQLMRGVAEGAVDPRNIVDMRGAPLNNIRPIADAAAVVSDFENFGISTDFYWPNSVQADIDAGLDPAFRVALDNNYRSIELGSPVSAIRLSQGKVKCQTDVFIPDQMRLAPFTARSPRMAIIATGNAEMRPDTVAGMPGAAAGSRFEAAHAGNYFYGVAGVSARGESALRVSAQIAVAAGQEVVLTVTGAGGSETGYAIYRSRRNGTSNPADMRLLRRVPRVVGMATEFRDRNLDIPGTTSAYMLNMTKGDTAITWRQLLPMFRFELFPTNAAVKPWAQLLFGYLRMTKRRHHVVFRNILPVSALWRPF